MKTRPISKEKLLTLRNSLPHGSLRTIAKRSGLSYSYVARVLNGDCCNTIIVETAIKLLAENQVQGKSINKKLEKALRHE